jgi:predicted esterase
LTAARVEHLPVRRTARLAVLGAATPALREIWIVCHGYAQLAPRFIRRFRPIAAPERLIVAPEALNRFYLDGAAKAAGPDAAVGATWMTSEDRATDIHDYVAYLDAVHAHVFARVERGAVRFVALGFSQGCATVCRWAAATYHQTDHVVLWSSGLPPELEPAPALFGGARLTLVNGRADRAVPPAAVEAQLDRLRGGGRAVEHREYDGGHDIDAAALVALAADVAVP